MMKVVINACYGGFSISKECAEWMEQHGSVQAKKELDTWRKRNAAVQSFLQTGIWPEGTEATEFLEIDAKYKKAAGWYGYGFSDDRSDPLLVQAVEWLGEKAGGECANLKIVEIPDGVEYVIDEYDGYESIHEAHRSWR